MKLRKVYDEVELCASPSGEEVYKWSYFTESGEVVEDERNMYEMIQSGLAQTLIKDRINEVLDYGYNNNDNSGDDRGIYADTTVLGTDFDSHITYLERLAQALATDISAVKSAKASGETPIAVAKTAEKDTKTEEDDEK